MGRLSVAELAGLIRDIPDVPQPGIVFKDITPLLAHPQGLASTIEALADPWRDVRIDTVVGIEARGFILGAAVAHSLGVGFVPIRKAGKLPGATMAQQYDLEYGTDTIEIHADAVSPGEHVLVLDDVLATGGTKSAPGGEHVVNQQNSSLGECIGRGFQLVFAVLKRVRDLADRRGQLAWFA